MNDSATNARLFIRRAHSARMQGASITTMSRHALAIAEGLLEPELPWDITDPEERAHAAESIAATVAALWEARRIDRGIRE